MSHEITEHHAKTLIEVIEQSSTWKLHPEKKPPFSSSKEAYSYVESHNDPLYINVPVVDSKDHRTVKDHLTVKVTSSEDDMVFTNMSFDEPTERRVHQSHLKLISSTVMEMLNEGLPEGKKVAPN